ncbi:uncharacterized protein BJ171DRAFT_28115 [Polychytrium aggregatum]|uniref:uncharacterized protein n=1 Tax=Polychytrium aggregatum TaxID=110093 RepID=UPI0022FE4C24|nr:uncharacterized protein BJ171DRAFT_28115 [Polychytrium aggregatum]KAI9206311.1 hypothetical protein BJ171DRAFT_28115 [Polychytrium aggregatum]
MDNPPYSKPDWGHYLVDTIKQISEFTSSAHSLSPADLESFKQVVAAVLSRLFEEIRQSPTGVNAPSIASLTAARVAFSFIPALLREIPEIFCINTAPALSQIPTQSVTKFLTSLPLNLDSLINDIKHDWGQQLQFASQRFTEWLIVEILSLLSSVAHIATIRDQLAESLVVLLRHERRREPPFMYQYQQLLTDIVYFIQDIVQASAIKRYPLELKFSAFKANYKPSVAHMILVATEEDAFCTTIVLLKIMTKMVAKASKDTVIPPKAISTVLALCLSRLCDAEVLSTSVALADELFRSPNQYYSKYDVSDLVVTVLGQLCTYLQDPSGTTSDDESAMVVCSDLQLANRTAIETAYSALLQTIVSRYRATPDFFPILDVAHIAVKLIQPATFATISDPALKRGLLELASVSLKIQSTESSILDALMDYSTAQDIHGAAVSCIDAIFEYAGNQSLGTLWTSRKRKTFDEADESSFLVERLVQIAIEELHQIFKVQDHVGANRLCSIYSVLRTLSRKYGFAFSDSSFESLIENLALDWLGERSRNNSHAVDHYYVAMCQVVSLLSIQDPSLSCIPNCRPLITVLLASPWAPSCESIDEFECRAAERFQEAIVLVKNAMAQRNGGSRCLDVLLKLSPHLSANCPDLIQNALLACSTIALDELTAFCINTSLSGDYPTSLRIEAWKLVPQIASYISSWHQNKPESLIARLQVTEADPPEILEAAACFVGFVSCAQSASLEHRLPNMEPVCCVCDQANRNPTSRDPAGDDSARRVSVAVMSRFMFLGSCELGYSNIATQFLKLSLPRVLAHCCSADLVIADSTIARNIIFPGMESDARTLRLAAGNLLSFFLDEARISPSELEANIEHIGNSFDDLVASNLPDRIETLIHTLGKLAERANEAVLYMTLSRLVLLLGTENLINKGVVICKLEEVRQRRSTTMQKLFEPFLARVGDSLIQNIAADPVSLREFAQILDMSQRDLCVKALKLALPALVIQQNSEGIRALARILRCESVQAMCIDELHNILAGALLSDKSNEALDFLRCHIFDAKKITIVKMFRSCNQALVVELSIELGDPQEEVRSKARSALQDVYINSFDDQADPSQVLALILSQYFFGIITSINHGITRADTDIKYAIKLVRSFEEVIRIIGYGIYTKSAQVLATLQTITEMPNLRCHALSCWSTFIKAQDAKPQGVKNLKPILGQIVAVLLRNYSEYTEGEKQQIVEIMKYLIVDLGKSLTDEIQELYLLPATPEFDFLNQHRLQMFDSIDGLAQNLTQTINGIRQENSAIVYQALLKLRVVLLDNRETIHTQIMAESIEPILNDTIKTLLDTCRRYNGTEEEIQILSCECLGIIGAVDPGRVDIPMASDPTVVIENFYNQEECHRFACDFIEHFLAPAIRSMGSSSAQSYFSCTLQELLMFCGFTAQLVDASADRVAEGSSKALRKRWDAFPGHMTPILRQLLGTHWKITTGTTSAPAHPVYPSSASFQEWVSTWALSLVGQVNGNNAKSFFGNCRNVIKPEYHHIALHLLPHICLNIVSGGTLSEREDITTEIMSILNDQAPTSNPRLIEKRDLCAQSVFMVVDHMSTWLRIRRRNAAKQGAVPHRRARKGSEFDDSTSAYDEMMANVDQFLKSIPQSLMAMTAYRCKAYARAIMHFERHMRIERDGASKSTLQEMYTYLQKIYAKIDEPDGMEGISKKVLRPTLEQQILEHESAGRWTSAQTCYELSLRESDSSENINLHIGLLKCLKNMDHLETMMTLINGSSAKHPDWEPVLSSYGVEAAWRLGDWESLESFLSKPTQHRFDVSLGRLLLAAVKKDTPTFDRELKAIRKEIAGPLSAASMESYKRAYEHMVKLHMVHEVNTLYQITQSDRTQLEAQDLEKLMSEWLVRTQITSPTFSIRESILHLRRTLLGECRLLDGKCDRSLVNLERGKLWLQTARESRKAGYFQPAYAAILNASELDVPFVHLEKGKLHWVRKEPHKAIYVLQLGLNSMKSANSRDGLPHAADVIDLDDITSQAPDSRSTKRTMAKTQLLLSKWSEETGTILPATIIKQYNSIIQKQPEWEKSYFYLGRYYNKLYESEKSSSSTRSHGQTSGHLVDICRYYGRALMCGTKFIYQTLPRLLTLWLDYGEQSRARDGSEMARSFEATISNLNKVIQELHMALPAYQFLTALPQLISRICHRNVSVHSILEAIIVKVVSTYPHQALWHIVSMSKSIDKNRFQRWGELLKRLKEVSLNQNTAPNLQGILAGSLKLTDQLLGLCNHTIAKGENTLSISRHFRELQRLVPLNVMIPLQSTLTVTLPTSNTVLHHHQPFPNEYPVIDSFHDEVEIMSSLQRPRKITMGGSDGKAYIFLCKPKDDLRKDCRLMEFNTMINKLLKKNPDSRRRGLHIRTYAVVPLNEECGLIEWVNNTVGFRHIVSKSYKSKNIWMAPVEVKKKLDQKDVDIVKVFTNEILPRHPPVFYEWFLETFTEPTRWFSSRLAYTTTTAVMSMVGYVVGLGDRHGENILFDETCGDLVHVDFNCLFEKGTTFEKPEKVPFRLTHNMVDAFGVTGVEGAFRKSCEVTMGVLRDNRDSLMSVLETFIHDPLCEWSKRRGSSTVEGENQLAIRSLQTIDRKLQGQALSTLPLSVEGQVHELINQATDLNNLAAMYVGWASFM